MFKDLSQLPLGYIPDDSSFVNTRAEQKCPGCIPLERKDGSLMFLEGVKQLAIGRPQTGFTAVRACSQNITSRLIEINEMLQIKP